MQAELLKQQKTSKINQNLEDIQAKMSKAQADVEDDSELQSEEGDESGEDENESD